MHVDRLWPGIELHHLLLELANSTDGTLQRLLDKDSFLRVHDLIVAFFKLSVYLNVLNVKNRQILEYFVLGPVLDLRLAQLIFFNRLLLVFNLFLQLVDCLLELQIICSIKIR